MMFTKVCGSSTRVYLGDGKLSETKLRVVWESQFGSTWMTGRLIGLCCGPCSGREFSCLYLWSFVGSGKSTKGDSVLVEVLLWIPRV